VVLGCVGTRCEASLRLTFGGRRDKEAGAVITVNLTMEEARAVADAIRELVERSEQNELIVGPIDWDDLRTASSKLAKTIDDQS
jgi:NTP pyrophosphatase (non-canonical NTP hydrolase)